MKGQKKIIIITAATVCLLAVLLFAVISIIQSTAPAEGEPSKTTDTWSAEFAAHDDKLAFLAEYLTMPSEVLDAEYHIVYHDNSTGMIPGPSDWDVRIALKIAPEDFPLWLNGFAAVSQDEIDLSWWDGLSSESIWWDSADAEHYRREGEFSYLVAFPESGVILKAVSTVGYPVNKSQNALSGDESFTVVPQSCDYTDTDLDIGIYVEYLQISGLDDTEKQGRINSALYEIVDMFKYEEESELELTNFSESASVSYSIIGADILSVQYATSYDHMMAAHPSAGMVTAIIDLRTGEKLKLSDILILNDDLPKILNAETTDEIRMEPQVLEFYEDVYKELHESIIEHYSVESSYYYLTENSMGFILYVPHVVGDYWMFEIAYEDIADFLTPDFYNIWKAIK